MTPYIILMTMGSIVMFVGLVIMLYYHFKSNNKNKLLQEIGKKSEERINADLAAWAKTHKARFISASLFKYQDTKLFEVDSILITDRALIVVEIKSIKGVVRGDASDAAFTKVLGSQQFLIVNPIAQNDRHIEHLQKMTNFKLPTISLIIYSNRAEMLDITNVPNHVAVIKHTELFETLDSIESALPPKITFENMRIIEKTIKKFTTNNQEDIEKFKQITKQVKGDK